MAASLKVTGPVLDMILIMFMVGWSELFSM